MSSIKFSISLPPNVVSSIDARGDKRSSVISNSVQRYVAILEEGRRNMSSLFTQEEIMLLMDTLPEYKDSTVAIGHIALELIAAIDLGQVDKKYGVDGKTLVQKLGKLSFIECVALIDAIEYWKCCNAKGNTPSFGDLFKFRG
jgi:metal-responsive CopG/Arc/MetJ family transcriptional regulator